MNREELTALRMGYTPPETALEAFDLLTGNASAADTQEALEAFVSAADYQGVFETDAVYPHGGTYGDPELDELLPVNRCRDCVQELVLGHTTGKLRTGYPTASEVCADSGAFHVSDGKREQALRGLLSRLPFADVRELGEGDDSYSVGPVSLWRADATDGYGRDRPADGWYTDLKLYPSRECEKGLQTALDPYSIDLGDLIQVADELTGYMNSSDALEWALEDDYSAFWFEGLPALADAFKQGRFVRAYKGPWLKPWITVAEALEVDYLVSSGLLEELGQNIANGWLYNQLWNAFRIVFDLESVEIGIDSLDFYDDAEKAKLEEVGKALADGGKLRMVTRSEVEWS